MWIRHQTEARVRFIGDAEVDMIHPLTGESLSLADFEERKNANNQITHLTMIDKNGVEYILLPREENHSVTF